MQSAPALGILIDLPLGLFMWTCLLRFVLSIFISEDSKVAPMRMLTAFTHPVMKVASLIAPGWMISRLEPLYAALVILVLRYYVFHWSSAMTYMARSTCRWSQCCCRFIPIICNK